jgi:protein gp37
MSENSKIEWTDHTFNPWIGCTKIAPECDNCYAAAQDKFRGWTNAGWGAGKPRRLTSASYWREPLKWDRRAAEAGKRERVFCASLADVFDGEVANEWRERLFNVVAETPALDWLILTKRPANVEPYLGWQGGDALDGTAWPLPANVWIGTSVGSRERLPQVNALRRVRAAIRFLSVEPLLEDLGIVDLTGIHWVIVGGESGPGARPCNVDWIRSIVRQCEAYDVPVFVKQLGANPERGAGLTTGPVKLKDRKGGDWNEWPEDLRIRQFPKVAA